MVAFMAFLKAFAVDGGVNLRGTDIGVAEHFLNCPEVGAVAEQVGGK